MVGEDCEGRIAGPLAAEDAGAQAVGQREQPGGRPLRVPPGTDLPVLLRGTDLLGEEPFEQVGLRGAVLTTSSAGTRSRRPSCGSRTPRASRQRACAPSPPRPGAPPWLDELLTALDVTSAHVVGCSYGGWLALDPRFYRWMITGALAGLAPRPLRPRLARLVANHTVLESGLMSLALPAAGYRRRLPPAALFTDADLHRLRTPAQFLLGARSALHDSRQVADRLAERAPATLAEIVPGAGHALPMDRPELVTDRILRFTAP